MELISWDNKTVVVDCYSFTSFYSELISFEVKQHIENYATGNVHVLFFIFSYGFALLLYRCSLLLPCCSPL